MKILGFPVETIQATRDALHDDAVGTTRASMTDLDFAVDILDRVLLADNPHTSLERFWTLFQTMQKTPGMRAVANELKETILHFESECLGWADLFDRNDIDWRNLS